ncbi:TonB-dependent receptor [Flavobacterium sp. NKUCC04_CG]|uniref:TonB-dependent receptor n=1 Tax=Flavobacterium sp. NKUCC04_CG TaxID=2842121 RepID=UPI001C5BCB84|nr:TonB-dependent receptor [Flavobacterium sp. NKUCC04_CG]MBW3518307.1 TonB-dependent receptor [Flavobacterium sp. NKUCC04_CG]
MIRLLPLFLLTFFSTMTQAQFHLSGIVTDEKKKPLAFATVTLLQQKDSTMIAYDSTNEKGEYHLNTKSAEKVILQVNYIGYQTASHNLDLETDNKVIIPVILKEGGNILDEILIKARDTGITFSKDTIKYHVKKFIDGTESNLGDVLDKLPGIEVDDKGSVKSGGKQVEKILLNGQNYYGGNAQIATQNIPAEAVENVEVLNNYSEYSLLKGFQSREQTVINVNLDKKWSDKLSGEMALEGGFNEVYNTKLNLMSMQSKFMISLISSQNNLGNPVFSIEEYFKLQGGVASVMSSTNNIISLTDDERQLLQPNRNALKRANGLSALSLNYQPKNYFKINTYLLYNNDKNQTLNSNEYLFPNQLSTAEEASRRTKNDLFSAFLKINYDKIKNTSLVYNGTISNIYYNQENNIGLTHFSSLDNFYEHTRRRPIKTKNIVSAITKIDENVFISEFNFDYQNTLNDYDLHYDSLYIKPFPTTLGDINHLRQSTDRKAINTGLAFTFLYHLNDKNFVDAKIYNRFSHNVFNAALEQTPLAPKLINDNYLHSNTYGVNLSWNKNKGFFRFKGGASFDYFHFRGGRESSLKKVFIVNPTTKLTLLFNERHSLSLDYKQSIETTSPSLFVDNPIVENFRTINSPNLFDRTYNIQRELKMSYFFFESFSNISVVAVGMYNNYKHQNTRNIFRDQLTTSYELMESPQTERLLFNTSLTKGLNFIPWDVEFRGNYTKLNFYNYLNNRQNEQITEQSTTRLLLKTKYKTKINTELFYNLTYNKSQSGINKPFYQSTKSIGTKLIYSINKNILLDLNYEYKSNLLSLYDDKNTFNIVSAKLSYKINKHFELSLIGDNLLNMKNLNWSSISYREDYIIKNNFAQIPGYALLGIKYKL